MTIAGQRRTTARSPRRRTGMTLLETVLALAVSAVAISIAAFATQERTDDIKAQIAGAQFSVVQEAAQAYIEDEYASIKSSLSGSTPYLIDSNGNQKSTDELTARGYLPTGWSGSDGNPYGHDYQIWVKDSAPSAPNSGFEALLVTIGSEEVETTNIATAALSVGGNAGFVNYDLDGGGTDTITGLYGGWSANISDYKPSAAGSDPIHLAYTMSASPETSCGEQLYRVDVPGCRNSNVVENVTAVFANDKVWNDTNGNSIIDAGELSTDPDKAIGIDVKNNVFIGGDTRVDGLMVVNSYLEQTPPQESCNGGNANVPSANEGNVFSYSVSGGCNFRLPNYVAISGAAGVTDTVNSLTIVVELNGGVSDTAIDFSTQDSATLDWGFGDGPNEPENCTGGGQKMIYQFLRFSAESEWLSQMVWQECA